MYFDDLSGQRFHVLRRVEAGGQLYVNALDARSRGHTSVRCGETVSPHLTE
jgi:hypothetical protein